ncbi:MAG: sigma 54-interacting transcriptional regulator [Alphaproteobacteria bacterium]|nr:sigma 54-interacting transcriptional regulator [Alphaproteobacteria bacterium]
MKAQSEKILLIEDDQALARVYLAWMASEGYDALHAANLTSARVIMQDMAFTPPAIILLDWHLPDGDGLEFLDEIRQKFMQNSSNPPLIIIITAHGSINIAVAAMKKGAYDFLIKPFPPAKLAATLHNAWERQKLHHIVNHYSDSGTAQNLSSDQGNSPYSPPHIFTQPQTHLDQNAAQAGKFGFIGKSLAMQDVLRLVALAAKSRAPVFIGGESGTGKELVAQAIHRLSPRAAQNFVALNCSALPKDLIESELFGHVKGAFTGANSDRIGAAGRAEGGSLFFDEIAELDLAVQAKLLRFLQTGDYQKLGGSKNLTANIRFISATHRDLEYEISQGRFREDLFYRLHVLPIILPPLRDRGDDILILARHFLALYAKDENQPMKILKPEVERALLKYHWPGNVRQLQSMMRQIVVMQEGAEISLDMLPDLRGISPELSTYQVKNDTPPMPIMTLKQLQYGLAHVALKQHHGNVRLAAAQLDINPATLYRLQNQPDFDQLQGKDAQLDTEYVQLSLAAAEDKLIAIALHQSQHNLGKAAQLLGINVSTLRRRRIIEANHTGKVAFSAESV